MSKDFLLSHNAVEAYQFLPPIVRLGAPIITFAPAMTVFLPTISTLLPAIRFVPP